MLLQEKRRVSFYEFSDISVTLVRIPFDNFNLLYDEALLVLKNELRIGIENRQHVLGFDFKRPSQVVEEANHRRHFCG